MLLSLAKVNYWPQDRKYQFNEWLHGQTGHPMGYARQAWSAAMFLYADHAVRTGQLPLFDALLQAKPAPAVGAEVNEAFDRPGGGPA